MSTAPRESLVRALAAGEVEPGEAFASLSSIEALDALAPHLRNDLSIDQLERIEALLKLILGRACSQGVAGPEARAVAAFQQRVGFLCKYKSYAVKCASPLGYSLFLQKPGEGFSFQRHITHKVEVFHVLEVLPGGFVFICDHDTWQREYDPQAFSAWLGGAPDDRYEPYRYRPRPGDVIAIEDLNVVHAVLGCTLEEFANASTDMVDRLHDQNAGADVPLHFERPWVEGRLPEIAYPRESRAIRGLGGEPESVPVVPEEVEGGSVRVLAESFVGARSFALRPRAQGPALHDPARAASLFVASGAGQVVIADEDEAASGAEVPPLDVRAGDLLTVLPGAHVRVLNRAGDDLVFSEHKIAPDIAFAESTEQL
jgi:mannose-6-phosphate isomerase-like protein (cupin superfamily)